MKPIMRMIFGVTATIRADGFTWRATCRHLGGNGTVYERFNGRWEMLSVPPRRVYRKLRAQLNRNIDIAAGLRSVS